LGGQVGQRRTGTGVDEAGVSAATSKENWGLTWTGNGGEKASTRRRMEEKGAEERQNERFRGRKRGEEMEKKAKEGGGEKLRTRGRRPTGPRDP